MRWRPNAKSRWRAISWRAKRWRWGAGHSSGASSTGAINRFKVVVTDIRGRGMSRKRSAADRGLHGFGYVDEAQTSAAVLGHNFPESRWQGCLYPDAIEGPAAHAENKASGSARHSGWAEIKPSPYAGCRHRHPAGLCLVSVLFARQPRRGWLGRAQAPCRSVHRLHNQAVLAATHLYVGDGIRLPIWASLAMRSHACWPGSPFAILF